MGIAALWSSVSTHQSAFFSATRRDAIIFAPGGVTRRSWTSNPRRSSRLAGHENASRRVHAVNVHRP